MLLRFGINVPPMPLAQCLAHLVEFDAFVSEENGENDLVVGTVSIKFNFEDYSN